VGSALSFTSTGGQAPAVDLRTALFQGLAPDERLRRFLADYAFRD